MKPFRWNLDKREQLGSLLDGQRAVTYPYFKENIQMLSSQVLARSSDSHLAFVGRSPESLFDYLSGVLVKHDKINELHHLNLSNRRTAIDQIEKKNPGATGALKEHFEACEISPEQILHRKKKTLFVDLVCDGGTFKQITQFLFDWAKSESISMRDFRLKIGFTGITVRTKTSPNTWRWQQQCSWVKEFDVKNIQNISIDRGFWSFLGDYQNKVTKQHHPGKWLDDECLLPPRDQTCLQALRVAYDLFEYGQSTQVEFAQLLSKDSAVSEKWLRRLIGELKFEA